MTKPSKERVKEVQDYLNEISMELSKKYSVCQKTISSVVRNETYKQDSLLERKK